MDHIRSERVLVLFSWNFGTSWDYEGRIFWPLLNTQFEFVLVPSLFCLYPTLNFPPNSTSMPQFFCVALEFNCVSSSVQESSFSKRNWCPVMLVSFTLFSFPIRASPCACICVSVCDYMMREHHIPVSNYFPTVLILFAGELTVYCVPEYHRQPI